MLPGMFATGYSFTEYHRSQHIVHPIITDNCFLVTARMNGKRHGINNVVDCLVRFPVVTPGEPEFVEIKPFDSVKFSNLICHPGFSVLFYHFEAYRVLSNLCVREQLTARPALPNTTTYQDPSKVQMDAMIMTLNSPNRRPLYYTVLADDDEVPFVQRYGGVPEHNKYVSVGGPTETEDTNCPVCYGDLRTVDCVRMAVCNHLFCRVCARRWVDRAGQNTCPLCRQVLDSSV